MRLTYRARAACILLFYNGFRLLFVLCQLLRLRLLIFGNSRFEFTDALAQGFADQGQFARAEDQEADAQDQQEFRYRKTHQHDYSSIQRKRIMTHF